LPVGTEEESTSLNGNSAKGGTCLLHYRESHRGYHPVRLQDIPFGNACSQNKGSLKESTLMWGSGVPEQKRKA